ncbi:MAG: GNAT family N-acetyltransferase [Deltaproteobacteria bacterium]|nr:GNAT family N-acetyltransferase [Deltaproteobacteria bacterium]
MRSSAWVGLLDESGKLVGSARAISDGAKRAWVYDVIVEPSSRGLGLGTCLMNFLLEHPALRDCQQILLGTKDARLFYERLGFKVFDSQRRAYKVVSMKKQKLAR